MMFTFIELSPFAQLRDELFTDDEFALFQRYLCDCPTAGDVIPGTLGCRKVRWKASGRGKRGGARVIYFLQDAAGQIVLVAVYAKNEKDDVPRAWLRRLKQEWEDEQSKTTG